VLFSLLVFFIYKYKKERKRRKNFQQILDSLNFPVWKRNVKGQLQWCNAFYYESLEEKKSEVLAKNLSFSPAAFQKSLEFLQKEADQSAITEGFCIIEGQRRFFQFTEQKKAQSILGTALDKTALIELKNELKLHIQAHQGLLENLSTGVALFGPDMRLKYFNRVYCMMHKADEQWLKTGPTLGEILEDFRQRRQIEEPADFQSFKKNQLKKFKELFEPEEELIHRLDECTWRKITTPHPLGGLVYLFEDVSDRLTLERQYNTLLAVKTETLNTLHEGIVVFGSNHRLTIFNPAFLDIWGYENALSIKDYHINNIFEDLRNKILEITQWQEFKEQVILGLTERKTITGRLLCQERKVVDFKYIPLPDGAHLLGFIDVTHQYRVEQALRERNEALIAADTLKSEFIAHISYELRTPLNSIIGFAEILSKNYFGALNQAQQEYLQGISHSSQHLLNLINNILDLALIESEHFQLDLQEVDLYDLLSSVVLLVHKKALDGGVEIQLFTENNLGVVVLDSRCIKQALFHLLNNALKFTKPGGKIMIRTFKEGKFLKIVVEDTGQGILLENQEKIFKKFEKSYDKDEKHPGAGLGLTLVKVLIEKHKGTVSLQSTPGVGTIITCTLPLEEIFPSPTALPPQISLPF
jgi:signal transduction histidine kinase